MKIITKPDCGNSPKKAFIRDFNIAFIEKNISFLLDSVTDGISWDFVGDNYLEGKDIFKKMITQMANDGDDAVSLEIENIVTNGKDASACGVIKTKSGKVVAFSDYYTFGSTKGEKIHSLKSFIIELN